MYKQTRLPDFFVIMQLNSDWLEGGFHVDLNMLILIPTPTANLQG